MKLFYGLWWKKKKQSNKENKENKKENNENKEDKKENKENKEDKNENKENKKNKQNNKENMENKKENNENKEDKKKTKKTRKTRKTRRKTFFFSLLYPQRYSTPLRDSLLHESRRYSRIMPVLLITEHTLLIFERWNNYFLANSRFAVVKILDFLSIRFNSCAISCTGSSLHETRWIRQKPADQI